VFLKQILTLIGRENKDRHLNYARDAIDWFKEQNFADYTAEGQQERLNILSHKLPVE
jgi:hypothetical protein